MKYESFSWSARVSLHGAVSIVSSDTVQCMATYTCRQGGMAGVPKLTKCCRRFLKLLLTTADIKGERPGKREERERERERDRERERERERERDRERERGRRREEGEGEGEGMVALTTAGQNTAAVLRKFNGNGTD